jgi:hypothetical protein
MDEAMKWCEAEQMFKIQTHDKKPIDPRLIERARDVSPLYVMLFSGISVNTN